MGKAISHMFIPDMQVTPTTPTDHIAHIGQYIMDRRPDKIIVAGDWWDMESLSHWSSKLEAEGKRYRADVEAGNRALEILLAPMEEYNAMRRKNGKKMYTPEMHFLMGNHEHRITRYIEEHPQMESFMGLGDLDTKGFTVHGFLEVVNLDGMRYSHYFYQPMTGRPYGGNATTRLKQIGHSFCMGHQQTLDVAVRYVDGKQQWGIVAGAGYTHDEDFKGPQGNSHWRGVVVLHDVDDGACDPMFVGLEYLNARYGNSVSDVVEDSLHGE